MKPRATKLRALAAFASLTSLLLLATSIPALRADDPAPAAAQSPDSKSATTPKPALALNTIPDKARIAVFGDSITELQNYSLPIEVYLVACAGRKDISIWNFGWGGEVVAGFDRRIEKDLRLFNPTIVTLCYGMNDGQYRPFDDIISRDYERGMRGGLEKMKTAGIPHVLVGTPGVVDSKFFNITYLSRFNRPWPQPGVTAADGYNANLRALGNIGFRLAAEYNQVYVDVHTRMMEFMKAAKAELGDDYNVCNPDGFHPNGDGGLVMAYAFLKGLGCDGTIGEISIDLKTGKAEATKGHTVLKCTDGSVELESARYPFCFNAGMKGFDSARRILPFLSFNQDLNRFILRVTNLPADKMQVKWGNLTKEFTGEQLTKGINLAAEFEKTPFDAGFLNFWRQVSEKQNMELSVVKLNPGNSRIIPSQLKDDPEAVAAIDVLRKKSFEKHEKVARDVYDGLQPVKHTITITAAEK